MDEGCLVIEVDSSVVRLEHGLDACGLWVCGASPDCCCAV